MKKIILCADDYGQNQAISDGILTLVKHQRLSAVSCMTTSANWASMAKPLQAYAEMIDVGLHFNLTHGALLSKTFSAQKLTQLLKNAFLGKLKLAQISAELTAQLDAFKAHFGRDPDFIDGHQHVHHFPIIRAALTAVYKQHFPDKKPYLRATSTTMLHALSDMSDFPKSQIIHFSGGLSLRKICAQEKIPCNTNFTGIYNFKYAPQYRTFFQKFLSHSTDGTLMMCHPGLISDDVTDVLHNLRNYEFNYFMSDDFLADCALYGVLLARFKNRS